MHSQHQLSHRAIEEFKAIYKEEFDEHLSDDDAQEMALRLLRFFGMLAQHRWPERYSEPQSGD